jgi:hypothetical protein
MSRPAQLEQQIAHVAELQAKMLEGENQNVELNEDGTPKNDEPSEPVNEPTVAEPPATINKEDYDKLEQRYRTLQGMHNAETSRLRAEMKDALLAINDLENKLVEVQTTNKPAPAQVKYVTAEDESEYGDTLEMVRRAAREEAENLAAKREETLLQRMAELEGQVGYVRNTVVPTVEHMTRAQQDQLRAEFWSTIDTQVPNWREVNDNQKFKDWLTTVDPLLGAKKQDFLRQAQEQLDASRVVGFFKEWERIQAGGQRPAPKNANQAVLEQMVDPGVSKGSGTIVQPTPKSWTRAEITNFYKDVQLGQYTDKPDQRKKIEADIFLAQREGRIS